MEIAQVSQLIIGKWNISTHIENGKNEFDFKENGNFTYDTSYAWSNRKGKYVIEYNNSGTLYIKGPLLEEEQELEVCAISEKYALLKGTTAFYVLVRIA